MNQMHDLLPHQRSWIVDTWNKGDLGLVEISEKFCLDFDELERWMWHQPGFPDLIRYHTFDRYQTKIKQRLVALLKVHPGMRTIDLARTAGTSEAYASKIKGEFKKCLA